jgi:hypothetical protein
MRLRQGRDLNHGGQIPLGANLNRGLSARLLAGLFMGGVFL